MLKKFLFAILPIFLLACNFLFPTMRQDADPSPASSEPDQPALSTPQSLTSPAGTFVIVRVNKANGDLMAQLATEAEKAKALGLSPFIEFDATWCPSCTAVAKSIKSQNPLIMQAVSGVYLIRADLDEWGWGDGENFDFNAIPIYYQLDENGNPTGAVIDGGAWGEDIPENFAPVLDKFFHTK